MCLWSLFLEGTKLFKLFFFQLQKTHLCNWNWVIIWNQTVTRLSICHLFFEQKQPENKEIQHVWEPLCGFNPTQYLLQHQQLQSSGLYILYMRQALKSAYEVLWHYMACMHKMVAAVQSYCIFGWMEARDAPVP